MRRFSGYSAVHHRFDRGGGFPVRPRGDDEQGARHDRRYLAVGLGVALAVGIVYSRLLERTIYTLLVALNSIPFVSLLLLGWVGTVLFFVVDYAERLCLPWHVSQRARHARSAERA